MTPKIDDIQPWTRQIVINRSVGLSTTVNCILCRGWRDMFQTKIFALSLYWLGQLLSHLLFWLYQSKEARKRLLLSKCYHVRTIWNDSDGNTETRNRLIVVVQGSVSSCLTKYWICLCKMINLDLLCCTVNERLDTRLLHWDITVTYVCLLRIFKRSSWYYKRRKKNRTKCWRSYNKTWKTRRWRTE